MELIEDEGDLVDEINQANTFKEALYASILKLDKVLDAKTSFHATPETLPIAAQTTLTDDHVNRVKLHEPKLQLRSFGGDLTRWTAF